MNKKITLLFILPALVGIGIVAAALAQTKGIPNAAPPQQQFHATLVSLQVTNYLAWASTNTGFPCVPYTNQYSAAGIVTNQVTGTNGLNANTGVAVNIDGFEHIGVCLQGQVVTTNTNTATIFLTFVTSMAQNQPVIIYGTNVGNGYTNSLANDFCTITNSYITVQCVLPTNGAGNTNWINWETNLSTSSLCADANWIGLYSMGHSGTNATGSYITNLTVSINEKQLPHPNTF